MTDLDVHQIEQAAGRLIEAIRTRRPCAPIRDALPDATAETAYAVQNVLTRTWTAQGRRIVGRKVGLTSKAVQRQLGVDQPDFGVLYADMQVADGAVVNANSLIQPRIEAEIAFELAEDLDDGNLDSAAVRDAIAHVVAALEIVDSRIAGWDITLADTVADNASNALFVLGSTPCALSDLDLPAVRMRLVDHHGTTLSEGTGADCMGDPVEAVLWLARTCRNLGMPLRAGETVLSGALGPMVPIAEDSAYTATFSSLGAVSARFARFAAGATSEPNSSTRGSSS